MMKEIQHILLASMFLNDEPFTPRQISNIEATAQNIAHSAVLDVFEKVVRERGMTHEFIARKLNCDISQIRHWLGSPRDLTLETLGLLMASMGHLPLVDAQEVRDRTQELGA
jgi:hypothetical protein